MYIVFFKQYIFIIFGYWGMLMRTILLSFKADVYKRVVSGEKIYEHRTVFPDEPITAYLYVSTPKQVITGKMVLRNRQKLTDWLDKYKDSPQVCNRINNYLKMHKYVMEISEFHETTEIPLKKLGDEVDRFIIPQMYYYIDNTALLNYIENHLVYKDNHIVNSFDNVDIKYICNG